MLYMETVMGGPCLPAGKKSKGCSLSNCSSGLRFTKLCFVYSVYFVLLSAASSPRLICAQGNFTIDGTSYDCWSNLICLGDAHRYAGDSSGQFTGRLSLIEERGTLSQQKSGIAYYSKPVRMLDPSTRQSASFNTSFVIDEVPELENKTNGETIITSGDGMAFVISADNSSIGYPGGALGFFDINITNSFRSIVVEFDNFQNGAPVNDINNNHVSIDFRNITYVVAANASDANVFLWYPATIYAWVEYSAITQQLQVRISNLNSRPVSPLLTYTVDLFDVVEEYMWVGFSGASGSRYSYYYIGDWSFESYGIALPPVPTLAKARSKTQSKLGIIVGMSAGIPVLLGFAGIMIFCLVRRHAPGSGYRRAQLGSSAYRENAMLQFSGLPAEFSYKQLSVATGAFREESKLGQGGFGSVYRGVLPASGTSVAVKRISGDSNQGEKEFMAEVSIISQLRHRNLIQLLGWCRDRGKYLIVYELMLNGSLDKLLFTPKEAQTALSWPQRFNIVAGTAAALDYLHKGWKQQVIHRDIKASNIMLDDEWNAKLGDFGLARLVDHQGPAATTMVAGTYGYIAPEVAASGKFTDKTDVYAFGAVALEIACGRRVLAVDAPTDEVILVDWVWQRLSEGDLLSVVDRRLDDYDSYSVEMVLQIGLLCSHPNPLARPSIRHVVSMLAGDVPVPSVPASKPAAVFRSELGALV